MLDLLLRKPWIQVLSGPPPAPFHTIWPKQAEYGFVWEVYSPPVLHSPIQSFLSPVLPYVQVFVRDEWNCVSNMGFKTLFSKCLLDCIDRNLWEVVALQVGSVMGSLIWQMSAGYTNVTGCKLPRATSWMSKIIVIFLLSISPDDPEDLAVGNVMATSQSSSNLIMGVSCRRHGANLRTFSGGGIRSHRGYMSISRVVWRCSFRLKVR